MIDTKIAATSALSNKKRRVIAVVALPACANNGEDISILSRIDNFKKTQIRAWIDYYVKNM
jgi:hypothetical protein